MKEMNNYIYLDIDGINSLYAQIVDEVVSEQEIETEKRSTGSVEGAFSAKAEALFSTDVNLSGEKEIIHSFRQKSTISTERKLQLLQEYIVNNENLIKEYGEIEEKYQTSIQNFVLLSTPFDSSFQRMDWFSAVRQIEQFGFIPFYKAPSEMIDGYEYSDSYYKTYAMYHTKVTMNLGIRKMCGYSDYGLSSHIALMFRALSWHNVPLGVFGHIYRVTERLFQIKPYAVWRVS